MGFDIERTENQVIIKMPLSSLPEDIEDVLNYFRYIQLGKSNVITDEDVDYFVEKSRGAWWKENKDRFKDTPGFERFQ